MVQVVSIEDVPIRFGSASFQSKLVSGAQYWVALPCKKHFKRNLVQLRGVSANMGKI